ncbi:MAG: hypothetical protein ABI585_11405 [Betaproteobacteria bacterium]
MNRQFFIAWIVLFVAWMAGGIVVHGVLLHDDYMRLTNLFRSETDSQQYLPWMICAHILVSGAFTWIYAKGVEARDWFPQGLRYGAAIALLTIVPTYLIYYAVQPMPGMTVVKQIVFDGILILVLGVVVAFIYRNTPRPAV